MIRHGNEVGIQRRRLAPVACRAMDHPQQILGMTERRIGRHRLLAAGDFSGPPGPSWWGVRNP